MTQTATSSDQHSITSPDDRLITVIGAGGKTSLVEWLAQQKHHTFQRIITTTTTKILPLQNIQTVLETDGPNFINRVNRTLSVHGRICVAHSYDQRIGKLIGLSNASVTQLHATEMADTIIIEGDGAAHKPLKAHAPHEPVIPHVSDLCIAVMGLDAIAHPLSGATVHRHEIFSSLTGLRLGERIIPKHLIAIATAPNGLFKTVPPGCDTAVLFNKTDIPEGNERVLALTDIIKKSPQRSHLKWFAGSIQQGRIHAIQTTSDQIDSKKYPFDLPRQSCN